MLGIIFQAIQLIDAIKNHAKNKVGADPWDGRTLEWSIPSPPPFYNFAHEPHVHHRDDFWHTKKAGTPAPVKPYEDIHMPKNTSLGFIIGVLAGLFGFAMVWQMPIPATVTGVAMVISILARTFNFKTDYYVKAAEVEKIEAAYLKGAKA